MIDKFRTPYLMTEDERQRSSSNHLVHWILRSENASIDPFLGHCYFHRQREDVV